MRLSSSLRRLCRASLAAVSLGGCLACSGEESTAPSVPLVWSVDTLAIVGVAEGDSMQEFGQLIAAELSATGDAVLLDLRRPGVFWFDSTGRFRTVTTVGRGPGEVLQPRAIATSSAGAVLVLDAASARLSFLRESAGRVVLDSSINTLRAPTSLCELAGRVYAGFLLDGMVAHVIGADGRPLRSFGPEPLLPQLDAAGDFGVLARRQIVEPRLFCDSLRRQVVLAGRSHPAVRAYDSLGHEMWSVELADVHSITFQQTEAGVIEGVFDPLNGASFVRSMIAWGPQHLLVQYIRSFPGGPPDGAEFGGIDSRLLDLTTGAEVGRSSGLPLIAATRGDRLVVIENVPFPRALIVRRRLAPEPEASPDTSEVHSANRQAP